MVLATGMCVAALVFLSVAADAKPARCFTTDDGYYPCSYKALDGEGGFRISAPGYATITLEIAQPGFAYGYARLGGRNRSLP